MAPRRRWEHRHAQQASAPLLLQVSPLDRSVLSVTDRYDEGGRSVVTHVQFPEGDRRSQTMRKRLLDGGRTFHVATVLTVHHAEKPTETIRTNSYFTRVTSE